MGVGVIGGLGRMDGMVGAQPGGVISVKEFGGNIGISMVVGVICGIGSIMIGGGV